MGTSCTITSRMRCDFYKGAILSESSIFFLSYLFWDCWPVRPQLNLKTPILQMTTKIAILWLVSLIPVVAHHHLFPV